MQKGPSKEALAEYFKNNRQYFDSLANQFKEQDPDYYNKFIAPFYSNPFYSSSASSKKGCSARIVLAVSILVFVAGIAAVSLFLSKDKIERKLDEELDRQIDKTIEQIQKDAVKPDRMNKNINPSEILDTLSSIQSLNEFQKGMTYFSVGDYDKAEHYFSLVKKDDPLFNEARKKLTEIRKKKLEEINK